MIREQLKVRAPARLVRLLFASALVMLGSGAHAAEDCGFPVPFPKPYAKADILDCFHPEGGTPIALYGKWDCADEEDNDLTNGCDMCQMEIDSGDAKLNGKIEYAGAITKKKHTMKFVVQLKSKMTEKGRVLFTRLVPTSDTAPIAPNPQCWMREWTFWKKT